MFRKLTLALGCRRADPDLCFGTWPRRPRPLPRPLGLRLGRRHCRAGGLHCFRLLRHKAARQYALWPARSSHHGLRLSEQTMDGK